MKINRIYGSGRSLGSIDSDFKRGNTIITKRPSDSKIYLKDGAKNGLYQKGSTSTIRLMNPNSIIRELDAEAAQSPMLGKAALSSMPVNAMYVKGSFETITQMNCDTDGITPKHKTLTGDGISPQQTTFNIENKSLNHGIDYFGDDESSELKHQNSKNDYFYFESEVSYSMKQYYEFFCYHFFYFILVGPFIGILGIFSKRLRVLFKNLTFTKIKYFTFFFTQIFLWIATLTTLGTFYYFNMFKNWQALAIDSLLVKTVIVSIIIRTTSIAGKYATYPKKLIKKIKEVELSSRELEAEHMLQAWRSQHNGIKHKEMWNAIERNEIDRTTLSMHFMSSLSATAVAGITKVMEDRGDTGLLFEEHTIGQKSRKYYKAEYVLEYLINSFNMKVYFKKDAVVGLFLGACWAYIPILLRSAVGLKIHGDTTFHIILQYVDVAMGTLLFYIQYQFYNQAVIDAKRKLMLMKQLTMIMSPRSTGNKWWKMLPTVNLLDPVSLRAWLSIRRIGLDYGRKYFYRHEIFLPVTLILMSISLIACAVILFTDKYEWSEHAALERKRLMWSFLVDALLFMASGFHFIFLAGMINDEFKAHIGTIESNKLYLRDIMALRGHYFRSLDMESISEIQPDSKILHNRPESILRNKLITELIALVPPKTENPEQVIIKELEKIIEAYDELLEGIKHDEQHEHVKILGQSVTQSGAFSALVGVLSVIFGAYQLIVT